MTRFRNRWFTAQKGRTMEEALAGGVPDGEVLEVGCWEGQSTVWFANRFFPRVVHCFDWWLGSPNDETARMAKERDVFAEFVANMADGTRGNYEVHLGDWRDTLVPWVEGRTVAWAYVDATHTYAEVRDTLAVLLPRMHPDGVIAGDDFRLYPGVGRAATEALADLGALVVPEKGHGAWYWRRS